MLNLSEKSRQGRLSTQKPDFKGNRHPVSLASKLSVCGGVCGKTEKYAISYVVVFFFNPLSYFRLSTSCCVTVGSNHMQNSTATWQKSVKNGLIE